MTTTKRWLLLLYGSLLAGSLACGDGEHPDLGVVPEPEAQTAERVADASTTSTPGVAIPEPGDDRAPTEPPLAEEAYKRWAVLLGTGLSAEARSLCTSWLEDSDPSYRIEAHKCLANLEIQEGRLPPVPELAPGATQLQPRHETASIDRALAHYEAALEINPLERASHMGRIDILILSGRYREANSRLDESLAAFDSREMLPSWFKLLGRFRSLGRYQEGIAYLEVIEKHHPLDHRVLSNLGAFHAIRGDTDKALVYAKQAVVLDPDDPINRWNLARLYDHSGDLKLANQTYLEALALFQDEDPRARCDYAAFLAERVGDADKACQFARTRCSDHFQQHCSEES